MIWTSTRTPLLPFERDALACAADAIEQWIFRNCDRAEPRFNVNLLRGKRWDSK